MYLILLLISAFIIRVVDPTMPFFTADEARIAYRGYTLSTRLEDEMGRKLPLIFNSLDDYQLPAVSYLVDLGEFLFGRGDFGARITFILIGVLLVYIIYKCTEFITPNNLIRLLASSILAFSPILIFMSKIPNEPLISATIYSLLFYLLTKPNVNKVLVLLSMCLLVLVSKDNWLILPLFALLTCYFYSKDDTLKNRITLVSASVIISALTFSIFLFIPQSQRSLAENNFNLFLDQSILNGINQLRGEGIKAGWPLYIERIFFNKTQYIVVGLINWLSHIQLSTLFSQFDQSNRFGFPSLGAVSKTSILPFIIGVFYLFSRGERKDRLLLLYIPVLTLPAVLLSKINLKLVITTLPFVVLITTYGFKKMSRKLLYIFLILMILETSLNALNFFSASKNSSTTRPLWVRDIIIESSLLSDDQSVAISDDIAEDVYPYYAWFANNSSKEPLNISFPYKVRQTNLQNIAIIGGETKFIKCDNHKQMAFVSKKALDRYNNESKDYKNVSELKIITTYTGQTRREVVYKVTGDICIDY